MSCDHWREAISALADGEDPGRDPALVEGHLAGCAACRSYRERAHALRRASAVLPAAEVPDLSRRIVKLDRVGDLASRWGVVRGVLAVVAVEIVALSLPALVLGQDDAAPRHEARHLGAFTLAYGAGLLIVAARPARARTLLPVAAVLAAALAVTATVDVVAGDVPLAGEAIHVPELLSVALVWLLAVPARRDRAWQGPETARPALRRLRAVPDDPGRRGAARRAQ